MEESSISRNSKEIPVRVEITNKAEESLKTEGLGVVQFRFSKCLTPGNCHSSQDSYIASSRIPAKLLREGQSFEFEVNLAELHWMDPISSYIDTNFPKNFASAIPSENIYFQASVSLPKGFKTDESTKQKIPVNKSFYSNTMTVAIE
jgi:hypothetical protein